MKKALLLLFTGILVYPFRLAAQDMPQPWEVIDTLYTRVDLFDQEDPMRIILTFNLKDYQRNIPRDE